MARYLRRFTSERLLRYTLVYRVGPVRFGKPVGWVNPLRRGSILEESDRIVRYSREGLVPVIHPSKNASIPLPLRSGLTHPTGFPKRTGPTLFTELFPSDLHVT
jgi:hypothetical protein